MRVPALWIATEGSFEVMDEPLTWCSYAAYRNGYFQGLQVLDAAGDLWRVKDAILERQPTVLDRLLNRRLKVEVRLAGPERHPPSKLAELLCACVDRDPGDVYNQVVEHEELKRLFRSATSVAELLHHARNLGGPLEEPAGRRTTGCS